MRCSPLLPSTTTGSDLFRGTAPPLREDRAQVWSGLTSDLSLAGVEESRRTVIIDGSVPDDAIRDMIEDSYDLAVSKMPPARRRALGWRGDASAS
jgi:hypothetical protein